jgi:autotransporter-associated beta strand protein
MIGIITGGSGGSGSNAVGGGNGSSGGTGGAAVVLLGDAPIVTIDAQLIGGFGGSGGTGASPTINASGGAGLLASPGATLVIRPFGRVTAGQNVFFPGPLATGIAGANLDVTNAGFIRGDPALHFLSGTNRLTLGASSLMFGAILVDGGGSLAITPDAGGSSLPNAITGSGSLIKDGPGTLTLRGANSFAGGLSVNAGTLALFDAASASTGRITLNGGAIQPAVEGLGGLSLTNPVVLGALGGSISGAAQVNEATGQRTGTTLDLRLTGGISGPGRLTIGGPGVIVLDSVATHGGGTTINAGATLRVGAGVLGGDILNNGSLIFGRMGTLAMGGTIAGNGGLVQDGPGQLILDGQNSYTGRTEVTAGTLVVNGSIAASALLSVGTTATIAGRGTLPSTTILAGGTIAPGNSVGTLTVAGDLTLSPGATTVLEVQGAAADRIQVAGTATLGGTVRLVPLGGRYVFLRPYVLIQASRVTGAFAAVSAEGSFGVGVVPTLSATETEVRLVLTPTEALAGLPALTTFNQRATARALDAARLAGADMSRFFSIYNAPADRIGAAVNQLSGEVATAGPAMAFAAADQFLAAMLDPLGYGRDGHLGGRLRPGEEEATSGPAYRLWGTAYGSYGRASGDGGDGSATRTTRVAGFAIGFDRVVGKRSLVGGAIAAGEGQASLAGGRGTARGSFGQFGVHGATWASGLTLAAALAGTLLETQTRRTLFVPDFDRLRGAGDSWTFSGRVEARQDGVALPGFRLQPFAALQWSQVSVQGYTERSVQSGDGFAQRVSGGWQAAARTELGAQADGALSVGDRALRGFARLAWGHYLVGDFTMGTGFAGLPNAGFTVRGARGSTNAALLALGGEAALAPSLSLALRLDSELSGQVQQIAGSARLRYIF